MHAMSEAEMARWVRDWYAAHPVRGARSTATAVDTFFATNYLFDADGTTDTPIDTVRIVKGQAVMWRLLEGTHTTTNGTGFADPNLGDVWDHPLAENDSFFTFQFDTVGVFPFVCIPHTFFDMRGVVVVSPG